MNINLLFYEINWGSSIVETLTIIPHFLRIMFLSEGRGG